MGKRPSASNSNAIQRTAAMLAAGSLIWPRNKGQLKKTAAIASRLTTRGQGKKTARRRRWRATAQRVRQHTKSRQGRAFAMPEPGTTNDQKSTIYGDDLAARAWQDNQKPSGQMQTRGKPARRPLGAALPGRADLATTHNPKGALRGLPARGGRARRGTRLELRGRLPPPASFLQSSASCEPPAC